jgi:phage host-nuclease inhibitor protein Gam
MYIPFSNIDLQARVWVYQADRKLTDEETAIITETLKASLDTWEAHGKRLTASGKVFENRFVVIAVDERDELPSGCSIDKSVHWLQEIGQRMNIDFFDRSLAYLDDQDEVQTIPVPKIKQAVTDEVILPYTTIFDNQVSTKAQWMKRWKIAASNSWLSRYFSEQTSL